MLPTPFKFQKVSIEKLTAVAIEQGACFVFDETGLGKTVISGHVAKNLGGKILVVSPKTNIQNWKKMLPEADVVTRQKVTVAPYDVVVVDEAHNYRTASGVMYKKLQDTIFKGNPDKFPYVVLVTATPYNNSVEEFMNLFGLCPLKVSCCAFWGLNSAFTAAMETEKKMNSIRNSIKRWGDKNPQTFFELMRLKSAQKESLLNLGSFLSNFASRNERKSISEYSDRFPTTENLKPIKIGFCEDIENLIWVTTTRINWCKFENYNADENEIPDEVFENNTVAGFLKSFLLKRLDSSGAAFISSVGRILKKCEPDSEDVTILSGILELWETKTETFDAQKFASISELIENNSGKVIVFSEYIETGEIVSKLLGQSALFITAKDLSDDDQLETIASEFDANFMGKKTDKYKVLVATDALSEGANLHRANLLVHYDQRWNPSRTIQREGRINRLFNEDTKPGTVFVASLETHPNIEKNLGLMYRADSKRKESEYIFDGFQREPEALENYHTILFPSGNNLRYNYYGRVMLTKETSEIKYKSNGEPDRVASIKYFGTPSLNHYYAKRYEIEHFFKIVKIEFNYLNLRNAMVYSNSLIHYNLFKVKEPLNFAAMFEALNDKLKNQDLPIDTWDGYLKN